MLLDYHRQPANRLDEHASLVALQPVLELDKRLDAAFIQVLRVYLTQYVDRAPNLVGYLLLLCLQFRGSPCAAREAISHSPYSTGPIGDILAITVPPQSPAPIAP